jgi:type II secretory ATPase GspE/PulE/Tfp pilus assembly ATPase PilB-like protein
MNNSNIHAPPKPSPRHLIPGLLKELHRLRAGDDDGHARVRRLGDVPLRDVLRKRAIDVHLDPQPHGARARFRIDGASTTQLRSTATTAST